MQFNGAKIFLKTILDDKDFDNSGSLCYGELSINIYYYNLLKEYL